MGLHNNFCLLFLAASLFVYDVNVDAYSQRQLDSFSNLSNGFIKENIVGRKLKDIKFKHGSLSGITITGITLPKISIKESPNELILSLSGAGVSIKAKYRIKLSWVYKESGSLRASASRMSLRIPVSLRSSSFLKVDASRCRDSIGRINYKAKGGLAAVLANILKGIVRGRLRRELRGDICKAVARAINNNRHKLRSVLKG